MPVSKKSMENVKKHRDTKLSQRKHLISEPSYHTTKFYTENLLAIKI